MLVTICLNAEPLFNAVYNVAVTNTVQVMIEIHNRHWEWEAGKDSAQESDAIHRIMALRLAGMDMDSAVDYVCHDPVPAYPTNFQVGIWITNYPPAGVTNCIMTGCKTPHLTK